MMECARILADRAPTRSFVGKKDQHTNIKGLSMRKLAASTIGFLLTVTPLLAANDPDSFGRSVKYLDFAQAPYQQYNIDCGTATDCKTLPANARFTFDDRAIARVDLPAYATNSMLCFSITTAYWMNFYNSSGIGGWAYARVTTDLTLESAVLNDPALINPLTKKPFGGKIVFPSLAYLGEEFVLDGPGGSVTREGSVSRECMAGLITRKSLQSTYGLSAWNAAKVFSTPMTIKMGRTGNLTYVAAAEFVSGFRLFGD
jgi:hypothetical protein